MLIFVIADAKPFRKERIASLVKEYEPTEVIMFNDAVLGVSDLEQYIYPSLFTIGAPLIHAQFILDGKEKDFPEGLIKKLIASPTVFVFEEFTLSKPFITNVKKHGALIHISEGVKRAAKENNLFSVTSLITMQNKKDRWLAYQHAISQYPIEAILGLLYWKLRDMAIKEKEVGQYHRLYSAMLEAHSAAWQYGTPLELAIEKVLLQ